MTGIAVGQVKGPDIAKKISCVESVGNKVAVFIDNTGADNAIGARQSLGVIGTALLGIELFNHCTGLRIENKDNRITCAAGIAI